MFGQKQKDNILDYPRKRMAKHLYQHRCLIYRVVQLMPVIDKLYKVKIKAVNMQFVLTVLVRNKSRL